MRYSLDFPRSRASWVPFDKRRGAESLDDATLGYLLTLWGLNLTVKPFGEGGYS